MNNTIYFGNGKEVGVKDFSPARKELKLTLEIDDLECLEEIIKSEIPEGAKVEIRADIQIISREQSL